MAYSPVVASDKTCIYALIDPRSNLVRYIGKADNPKARKNGHLRDVREKTICHRVSWIRGLLNEGLKPEIKVLFTPKKENWQEVERQVIAHYRQFCNLVNMTDGGDGQVKGHIPWNKGKKNVYSDAVIEKMKKSAKQNYLNGCDSYKLNRVKRIEIGDLYKNGLSMKEIAVIYGISAAQIGKVLSQDGIKFNDVKVKKNPIRRISVTDESIISCYKNSAISLKDIAVKFNISAGTVSSRLLKNGISAKKNRSRLPISGEALRKMSESAKLSINKGRFNKGIISHNAKPVFQFSKDGFLIKEWISVNNAKVNTGIKNIMKCLSGERPFAGGFIWKRKI